MEQGKSLLLLQPVRVAFFFVAAGKLVSSTNSRHVTKYHETEHREIRLPKLGLLFFFFLQKREKQKGVGKLRKKKENNVINLLFFWRSIDIVSQPVSHGFPSPSPFPVF